MRQIILTLFAASLLAGCTAPQPSCETTPSFTVTNYFTNQGIPFVLGALNQTPAALIFDTGSIYSFVTPVAAEQAGLTVFKPTQDMIFFGPAGPISAQETVVETLSIGSAVAQNIKLLVLPLDRAKASDSVSALDGDIAPNIISNYDVDIDFPDNRITFYSRGHCGLAGPPWQGAATSIPIKTTYYGKVYLPIAIDGQKLYALLDTGTARTTISHTQALASHLDADLSGPSINIAVEGIGGTIATGSLHKFNQLTVGTDTISEPTLDVVGDSLVAQLNAISHQTPQDPFDSFEPQPFEVDDTVILGEDYIRHHRLFLSYSTKTLFVQQ